MADDADLELELRIRAKALLRKRSRALRAAIPREARALRSAKIVERLLGLPAIDRARRVALFWPIEGRAEVDLTALDAALRGKREVYYPSIDPEDRVMTFRRVEDPAAMSERGLGFVDPGPDAPEADTLDVVVVPALQIDGRGYRLGYGGGFYDRTLPRFCPPALAVAVAFDFQLVAEVPITPGDVAVGLVVTDERVLEPER